MATKKSDEASKTRASGAYERSRSKAEEYAKSPEKLGKLVDDASKKASQKNGPLKDVWSSFSACLRLLRAYANGTYRRVPWQSLLMIIASVTYFVMPIDLIPDFLVAVGFFDDAALIGWTMKSAAADIEEFIQWEQNESAA